MDMLFFCTVLEVYQFARDAAVAEAWLIAHEPYLLSQDFGVRKIYLHLEYNTPIQIYMYCFNLATSLKTTVFDQHVVLSGM